MPDRRLRKHSVLVAGHPTSITLEGIFWRHLQDFAAAENISLNALVTRIDEERETSNLSSALRVFVVRRLAG